MYKKWQRIFYVAAKIIEMVIAACILLMILALMAVVLHSYLSGAADLRQEDALTTFLQRMLSFVVGIEFVKMLILHSPESVIDVLIFATSRQMIVDHTDGLGLILRIVSIAILFAIQKFLIPPRKPEEKP